MRRQEDFGYFHVCTDGTVVPWMFQDDKDFIAGVNRIAICYLKTGAEVLAYVLMDNHVHFVLYGTMPQCKEFITLYKRLTGKWIQVRYGISDFLRLLPTDILRIDTEERLLNTLAYIDRNSLIAGYSYLAGEYPWGSARYLFKDNLEFKNSRSVSSISLREQRSLFSTRVHIPDTWKFDNAGMICPLSYIDVKKVESYFKTPIRYSYFLSKKLEGIVEQDFANSQKSFIPDKELRQIVRDIAQKKYGVSKVVELDVNSRLSIARKLRYDYASSVKQISRMLGLEKDVLQGFI